MPAPDVPPRAITGGVSIYGEPPGGFGLIDDFGRLYGALPPTGDLASTYGMGLGPVGQPSPYHYGPAIDVTARRGTPGSVPHFSRPSGGLIGRTASRSLFGLVAPAERLARGFQLALLRAPGWSFMWPMIIDTDGITEGVAWQFVERIEQGYEWPVRTGYSKNNFYALGSGIYNFADYAYYVEHARNSPHRQVLHRLYGNWEPDTPQAFASAFVGV